MHSGRLSWRAVRSLQNAPRGRCPCTTTTATNEAAPRPLHEMPGPRSFPLLGTLWRYLPFIGEYQFDRLHWNGARKFEKYGPAVREEMLSGMTLVWLFSPSDIEVMYRSGEGKHPRRRSHLALQHFRLSRPHIYSSGGLLPTNGPEWARIRTVLQRSISKPRNVRSYIPSTDVTMKQFLELVRSRVNKEPEDFLPQLSRLFTEVTGLVAFDARLGALEGEHLDPNSRAARLVEAAFTSNSCVLRTDNGPQLWRYFRTPLYRKLERALLYLEEVAVELIQSKVASLQEKAGQQQQEEENEGPPSLLEQYLSSPDLDRKDVIGMAVDMLMAGVDTTTYTSSFTLYHLARNPEVQEKLRQEARTLLPTADCDATTTTLDTASYTKAVLKESLRLNPVSVGVGRILEHDSVFSGFLVPRGTVVVTQNQVSCRQPQWIREPDRFLPERWIKGHPQAENPHPFLSLPFGHGPRTCIARRLAEQSVQLLLLRIIRDFEVSWEGDGDMDCISLLINKPDKPLKLRFRPVP